MSLGLRIALFILALVAALLVSGILLDIVQISEAKEWGVRIGGVIAVIYLFTLVGSLLFHKNIRKS